MKIIMILFSMIILSGCSSKADYSSSYVEELKKREIEVKVKEDKAKNLGMTYNEYIDYERSGLSYNEDIDYEKSAVPYNETLKGSSKKEIVKKIKSLDIDEKNYQLFLAVDNDDINKVKLLLENEANVNGRNYNDETPVFISLYRRHAKITKLLIDYGADLNVKNFDGLSAKSLIQKIANDQHRLKNISTNSHAHQQKPSSIGLWGAIFQGLANGLENANKINNQNNYQNTRGTMQYNQSPYRYKSSSPYRYKSSSGNQYKYDLSNSYDQSMYSTDTYEQVNDYLNPAVHIDRVMGEYGGGIR